MSISTQPGEVDAKFARDAWLRALAKTATIGERGITLPVLIERLAGQFSAAPALVSAEASMSYGQLGFRCNQYSRWGIGRGSEERRCRGAADVQLRRVSGDMAGFDAHRRGGCAGQFAACRRSARAFDKNRGPQVLDRRRGSCVPRRGDPAALAGRDWRAASRDRAPEFRAAGVGARGLVGRAADGRRARSRRRSMPPRSISIPRAPPDCRKRPRSATTG